MSIAFKRLMLTSLMLCCAACTTTRYNDSSSTSSGIYSQSMNDVAIYAMGLVDTPYKYGGNTPDGGLDCSGFVVHVFQKVLNKHLPRTSREISGIGVSVEKRNLMPGDLVFFNTLHRPHSHVGIYVGQGRFVHAPGSGKAIKLAELDAKYWRNHFDGAQRIVGN